MGAGVCLLAGVGRGELAGLPELDEVFQAGEQACEDGHDHGVQRIGQPERSLLRLGGGAQVGDPFGQWRCVN
ncbi:MAG: hypothetical protein IT555_08265 [Acetobacteraceae bacterium]|nr:hypothetical protein [Acetobacteraceae bacterium]